MDLTPFSLEGKRALVTGASGDIGRAVALALADHGAQVALVARSVDKLEAVADEVRDRGVDAIVRGCNVTDPDAIAATAEEVGEIDVLVNNAGGARFLAPPLDVQLDGWNKTVALNLTAPFLLSQAFGRGMIERGRGAIVNVSTLSGVRHLPGMVAYSAAKAGLQQQTQALAREWGPHGVRVNAVAPGFIDTSAWESFDKGEIEREAGLPIPLARWATAQEVALPIVFLASDAASYITGVTLLIDGGMLA